MKVTEANDFPNIAIIETRSLTAKYFSMEIRKTHFVAALKKITTKHKLSAAHKKKITAIILGDLQDMGTALKTQF